MLSAKDEPHSLYGTVAWAAPEQLYGDGTYSAKVDMWCVACVVFYLLTSLSPFYNSRVDEDPAAIARYKFSFWPRLDHRSFFDATEQHLSHSVMVRGVSLEANMFLQALIRTDPKARLSAEEALKHKWINPKGTELMDVALRGGSQALVNMLTKSNNERRTDLHKLRLAAAGGHLDFVQRILSGRVAPVMDEDGGEEGEKEAALVVAAAGGYSGVITMLLFAEVHFRTRREGINVMRSACQRALEGGHTAVVAQL